MILQGARDAANLRFNESLLYLVSIGKIEVSGQPATQELKVLKGLFFVLLYGAVEKSCSETVQLLLSKIKALRPKNEHVIMPFNVVTMARKWKSIKDSGYSNAFVQMKEFFDGIDSIEVHQFDETLFSATLQNVWAKTIDEVIGALGVTGFTLKISQRALIDELVDKRNAVAHGRESASSVGEKYECKDLNTKLNDTQALIFQIIDRLELFLNQREFIDPTNRHHYLTTPGTT
jgi:RiboL-PSP-HEPN